MSEWKETEIGLIPRDWDAIKFEKILEIPLRNGLNKPSRIRGDGYKMINMNEIFAHNIIKDISMELVPLTEQEKKVSLLNKNDLLFARQSLVFDGAGKCSIFVGESKDVCFEGHLIRARLDKKISNPLFYYYFFSSDYGKRFIRTIIEQAVVAGIRASDLKELVIPYAPKQHQDRSADVLSCLDAKIENLRRQNETLEAIAQTLFKYWFIDFEFPDADGKPYESSGGEMVDSAIGDIPKGWQVGKLKDVSDITSSKRIFSSEYVESGIPFYRSKEIIELHAGQNVTTELYISAEKFNAIKSKFDVPKTGEILLTSVGTIGIPYLIDKNDEFYFKDGNLTWIKNFKNGFSGVVIYYWLKSDSTQNKIKQNTIGSTQKALTIQALGNISIFIPDSKTLNKYTEFIEVINSKIETNIFQIQTLTKTREALLPKLMSGQLRVKE